MVCFAQKIKNQIILNRAKQKAKIEPAADTIPHPDLQFPNKGGPKLEYRRLTPQCPLLCSLPRYSFEKKRKIQENFSLYISFSVHIFIYKTPGKIKRGWEDNMHLVVGFLVLSYRIFLLFSFFFLGIKLLRCCYLESWEGNTCPPHQCSKES